jgi:hypothetical protein
MGAYASGDQGEHRAVPSYLLAGPVTTEEGAPSRRSPSTLSQEERSDPVRRCPCGCGDVLYSAEANIGTGTLVFFRTGNPISLETVSSIANVNRLQPTSR